MEFQEHKRLIELLPEFLRRYREYKVIMDTEQIELDNIHLRISNLLSDVFIDTATEEGIAHKEKMYGIIPPEGASLEERRFAVKAKESRHLPYTIRQYRDMLTAICGEDNFKLTLDHNNYLLNVKVRAVKRDGRDALSLLAAVDSMTKQVIPANLVYGSALFDYHSGLHTTYSGIACSMRKHYEVEVV